MKITPAWLLGWGLRLGLGVEQTLNSTPGELMDYIASYAIANGAREKFAYSFDEVMGMN